MKSGAKYSKKNNIKRNAPGHSVGLLQHKLNRLNRSESDNFSLKPYVVTPHLNCLDEMVQMRGHNICFMQN